MGVKLTGWLKPPVSALGKLQLRKSPNTLFRHQQRDRPAAKCSLYCAPLRADWTEIFVAQTIRP